MKSSLLRNSTLSLSLVFSIFLSNVYASNTSATGGVSLGATRVIYPINAKQVSLPIVNHSAKDRYLINSWVEDYNEQKTKDFLITPPLFVAEANTENTLRIINIGGYLPSDRESVYWVNVKAIPSIDKDTLENKNLLQLAVLSRIKLFVRPNDLPYKSEVALNHISFSKAADGIEVDNQSPYHISFVNLYVNGEKSANAMATPFSKTKITKLVGEKISYQTVNDFGGLTPKVEFNIP